MTFTTRSFLFSASSNWFSRTSFVPTSDSVKKRFMVFLLELSNLSQLVGRNDQTYRFSSMLFVKKPFLRFSLRLSIGTRYVSSFCLVTSMILF
jgi:hypothetical protein